MGADQVGKPVDQRWIWRSLWITCEGWWGTFLGLGGCGRCWRSCIRCCTFYVIITGQWIQKAETQFTNLPDNAGPRWPPNDCVCSDLCIFYFPAASLSRAYSVERPIRYPHETETTLPCCYHFLCLSWTRLSSTSSYFIAGFSCSLSCTHYGWPGGPVHYDSLIRADYCNDIK